MNNSINRANYSSDEARKVDGLFKNSNPGKSTEVQTAIAEKPYEIAVKIYYFPEVYPDEDILSEEIFLQKKKDLRGLDTCISPLYPETWKNWATQIRNVVDANRWSENNLDGYKSDYEAFIKSDQLALHRMQFLRHLMLETDFIRHDLRYFTNLEVAKKIRDLLKMPVLFFMNPNKSKKTPDTLALLKVGYDIPEIIGGAHIEEMDKRGYKREDYFIFADERHIHSPAY